MNEWFDRYSLQARLAPSLLCLFPLFLSIAIQFPGLHTFGAGLVSLALTCGVLTLASHFARSRGKRIELRLNEKWGGRPTTRFLLNKSSELDKRTQERYFAYFSENIPDWHLSDDRTQDIESAVRWLLEQTRDTARYSLIFRENISYGFRRNSLGMKPFGILIAMICVVFWGVQLRGYLPEFASINPLCWTGLGISFLFVLWWLFVVREGWVREAGDAYAKALLGAIDAKKTVVL